MTGANSRHRMFAAPRAGAIPAEANVRAGRGLHNTENVSGALSRRRDAEPVTSVTSDVNCLLASVESFSIVCPESKVFTIGNIGGSQSASDVTDADGQSFFSD